MHLLIVTDIFGRTSHVDTLLTSLSDTYASIEIIDPYEGREMDFGNEGEAYEHFRQYIGLDGYIEKLMQHLQANTVGCEQHLLGFSVGGSAIWAVSARLEFEHSVKGICFYSSQIRNLLHLQPRVPIDLYFPKLETHFNVDEVMAAVSLTPRVNCYNTAYLHGFMNEKSVNFDKDGCKNYLEILRKAEPTERNHFSPG